MELKEFESALEDGLNGKIISNMGFLNIQGSVERLEDVIPTIVNRPTILNELMYSRLVCQSTGWSFMTSWGVLVKTGASWTIDGTKYAYTGLFEYRYLQSLPEEISDGTTSMDLDEIDLDNWFEGYLRAANSGTLVGMLKVTTTGDFDELGSLSRAPRIRVYGHWSRSMQPVCNARHSSNYADCAAAGSYRITAREGRRLTAREGRRHVADDFPAMIYGNIEVGEADGSLRLVEVSIEDSVEEEPYTGWMPEKLGNALFDLGQATLFEVDEVHKITFGKNIAELSIDNRLYINTDSELIYENCIYPIGKGTYFLKGQEAKDPIAYSRWINSLPPINISPIVDRLSELKSLGEGVCGIMKTNLNRNLTSVEESDTSGVTRIPSGKITKM